jgi:hypothetical protein
MVWIQFAELSTFQAGPAKRVIAGITAANISMVCEHFRSGPALSLNQCRGERYAGPNQEGEQSSLASGQTIHRSQVPKGFATSNRLTLNPVKAKKKPGSGEPGFRICMSHTRGGTRRPAQFHKP